MDAAIRVVLASLAVPILIALLAPHVWSEPPQPPRLPAGFVRLGDVAPGIRQDIRYARTFNFTGRVVAGYDAPQCVLLRQVAKALLLAEARLEADGYALKVYDCYRPARAVKAFAAWAKTPGGDGMKAVFYPGFNKSALFALGYIASHSRHSLGTAIDVGLVRRDDTEELLPETGGRCDGPFEQRAQESTLDMGTAYDCFSAHSATASAQISAAARANRDRLRSALEVAGFHNYAREWWHFEYIAGSRGASRDFPVQ